MRLRIALFAVLLCLPALTASSQSPRELTVFAATSLTDAFERLAEAFMASEPDAHVTLNLASSSRLAAQLLAGADADIFASANQAQMDVVVADGRVAAESVVSFASNELVLIAPADNPAGIHSVADLGGGPLLLVLAVAGTPIRDYTDAMLRSHNADYGADFAERALSNLVSEESNVRQVVARVTLGEADAGIVYRSDVHGAAGESLTTIAIEPRHNQRAIYPIASLVESAAPSLAQAFVEFTLSNEGKAILLAAGFCAPNSLQPESADEEPVIENATPTTDVDGSDAGDEPAHANACDAPNATA